jgi:hypothetical protein
MNCSKIDIQKIGGFRLSAITNSFVVFYLDVASLESRSLSS